MTQMPVPMQLVEGVQYVELFLELETGSIRSTLYWPGHDGAQDVGPMPSPDLVKAFDDQRELSLRPRIPEARFQDKERELVTAVVKAGLPGAVLKRLHALCAGQLGNRLLAIKVSSVHRALDPIPWELIGTPKALGETPARAVVWRGVRPDPPPRGRAPDSVVLLAGSSPIDAQSTHAEDEFQVIGEQLDQRRDIRPVARPRVPFGAVKDELGRLRPAIVHLAVHGTEEGTKWQASTRVSRSLHEIRQHLKISPDQLIEHLAAAHDTYALVLNICDSGRADGSPPTTDALAKRIAQRGTPAVIGMTGQISVVACIDFARSLYHRLVLGLPFIEAFAAGIRAIRNRTDRSANLWTMPVLYAGEPGCVIFPTSAQLKARRMAGRVRELAQSLADLEPGEAWAAADWSLATARVEVGLGVVRSTMADLIGKDPGLSGEPLARRLELSRLVFGLDERLASLDGLLQRLGAANVGGADRASLARHFLSERPRLVRALRRLGDLLVGEPPADDRPAWP
jgi:hypothetical protein